MHHKKTPFHLDQLRMRFEKAILFIKMHFLIMKFIVQLYSGNVFKVFKIEKRI